MQDYSQHFKDLEHLKLLTTHSRFITFNTTNNTFTIQNM